MFAPRVILLWSIVLLALPLVSAAGAADAGNGEEVKLANQWNRDAERYMDQGAYEQARSLYLRALAALEGALGPEHPATITTLGNVCDSSIRLSAWVDAKPTCVRALALREKVLGPNHPDVARSLSDLGLLYANEGDFRRAESLLERALAIDRAGDTADSATLLNNLGFLYAKKKKYARAEDYLERAIGVVETTRGPSDPDLVTMHANLATVYLTHHRYDAAAQHYRAALAIADGLSGSPQLSSVPALVGLARAEAALGNRSEAKAFLERADGVVQQSRAYLELGRTVDAARSDLALR